jgi:hypothetical protein
MSSVSVGDGGDRSVITSTSIDDDNNTIDDNDTILGQKFRKLVEFTMAKNEIVDLIVHDLILFESLAHLVMYLQLNLRRSFYRNRQTDRRKVWKQALQDVFQELPAHCKFLLLHPTVRTGIMKVRVKP